ncbi:polysaccharide biosynthesis protein [Devosia sp. A449]
MNDHHASLYMVSRLGAAGLNLLSVAIFTRLATPAVYGVYLVGFATSFIVFATLCQWLLHAHFGVYAPARAARLAGALIVALGAVTALGSVLLLLALATGLVAPETALGIAVLSLGFIIHIGAVELGRARLLVAEVTASGLLRGVLILALGSLALLLAQSASLLLTAIGLGQALAAAPVLRALWRDGIARPEPGDVMALLRYGWPLIVALAAAALALNLDRLVLERLAGAAAVGSYGAVSDVTRQSFVVLGEAIAAAYVSQAKALGADTAQRRAILRRAFLTLWTIVLLGMTGWLVLGPGLLGVLLDADYAAAAPAILPFIVLGTGALTLRAYYFGQVIYFAGSVRREVIANIAMLALTAIGVAILVPAFGPTGAAAAFALAQLGGLLGFLIADRQTRLMPVDLARAGLALLVCAGTSIVGLMLLHLAGWWVALLPVLAASLWLGWRWDLFGARQLLAIRRQ